MNLERHPTTVMTYPPVLRIWSALTAIAAFATVLVGTLVTTFHVGMADPLWPTAPWHLLVIEQVPNFGFYVEHTHRIVGYLIGTCILVQTIWLWWSSPSATRRWGAIAAAATLSAGTGVGMYLVRAAGDRSAAALANIGFFIAVAGAAAFLILAAAEVQSRAPGRWQRCLVTLAFVGVVVLGMLGGLRVYLNELVGPTLAVIHGLFAQTLFALTTLLALMTTRDWNGLTDLFGSLPLRRLTLILMPLTFVQILFGGLLRHLDWPLAARLHPMSAFAVAVVIALLIARVFVAGEGSQPVRRLVATLGGLLVVQVVLGVEALVRALNPETRLQPVTIADAAIRSAHVLIGFIVFAASAVIFARTWKAKLL